MNGRFWLYLVERDLFGPVEFSCAITMAGGHLLHRRALRMRPSPGNESEIVRILDMIVRKIEEAAIRPDGSLQPVMNEAFDKGRKAYAALELGLDVDKWIQLGLEPAPE
jgi:hypothetical protein